MVNVRVNVKVTIVPPTWGAEGAYLSRARAFSMLKIW
mgnify:CR=1 FL=1